MISQYGAVLVNQLLQQLGREVVKKLIKEKGKDFMQGAVIDYAIQATFNYAFDNKPFAEAASPENINWLSVGASGLESTISYNSKYAEYGISMSFACIVNGWSDVGGFNENFDFQNCAVGIVGAGLGKQIPFLFKYTKRFASYSVSKIRTGLTRLNINGNQADDLVESILGAWSKYGRISKLFNDFPDLPNKIGGWDDSILKALDDDLVNTNFFDDISKNVDLLDSWKVINKHPQLRVDGDVLRSLKNALDDDFLKTLDLENLISNKWTQWSFGCPSCLSGGKPYINEILDNLNGFKQFANIDGADKVISNLSSSKNHAIGANWMMKFTKDFQLNPSSFEDIISDGQKFTADIFADGKYFECKSWSSDLLSVSNFTDQFTNYLHKAEITRLDQFGFYFDPSKWTPSASQLNSALKTNSSLFDPSLLNNKYKELFGYADVDNITDVNKLIDYITSNKFNNIINPN